MRLRIYIDTSVIGGCYDPEFRNASRKLIKKFEAGDMIAIISELTQFELENAPERIRSILGTIPEDNFEYVEITKESTELAQRYLDERIISKSKSVDAEHIAIAVINRADVLVSWNYKHIVNIQKIRGYNSVNLKSGYPLLDIRAPHEVIDHED